MTHTTVEEYSGKRFAFGRNWARFLEVLDEQRVIEAQRSLSDFLLVDTLRGKTFLDIGSGSGLFSFAARRLGAVVRSFDFDADAVACTRELKRRYFPGDPSWTIERASVLDSAYLTKLGRFDIVYSWGVLHHTGAMWQAIDNAAASVGENGTLCIAIYNDQGWKSRFWRGVKFVHNSLPRSIQPVYATTLGVSFHLLNIVKYTILLKPAVAIGPLLNYSAENRGMSVWRDMSDWIGGYPYEVATFERLRDFVMARGFRLINGKRETSLGCHQMLFARNPSP